MIIFEPYWLDGFLSDYTFQCENETLRNVERKLVLYIKQFEFMEDDVVLEPYFRIGWQGTNMNSTGTDFGDIKIVERHAKEASLAYLSNFPVQGMDDIERMQPRSFQVDRAPALQAQSALMDIFGDIVPVKLANFDNFDPLMGDQPFTGNFFIGVTWDTFKLIGAEAMMLWPYDQPETLKALLDFLVDDKKRFFNYLARERLLDYNTDNQFGGSSCCGYVHGLPSDEATEKVKIGDLWTWSESREPR